MSQPTFGLIMIIKNEAHNLPLSLEPIAGLFDEVVVVDTGSTDNSPALCREMGAKVFNFKWVDDFSAARNYSIACSSSQWLLWLDADNSITPAEVLGLKQMLNQEPAIIWAQEVVEPGQERLWQKRVFPRLDGVCFSGRVHEQLTHPAAWPARASSALIRHWGYVDPSVMARKGLYYLALLEATLQDDPSDYYAHFQAARCLMNLRQSEQALQHLKAVTLNPAALARNHDLWMHAHILQAQAQTRLGQPAAARQTLQDLASKSPPHGLIHYHLGRMAYENEQWSQAHDHFRQAAQLGFGQPGLDLNPEKTMFMTYYFMGQALNQLGFQEKAVLALQRAVSLQEDNLAVRTTLAETLLAVKRREEARQVLMGVLSKNPANRQARRLWVCLEQAA